MACSRERIHALTKGDAAPDSEPQLSLTVHGFPGYAVNETVPTLVEILDGKKPANTPAIRVDLVPGSTERYSGAGYTIL